jgi:hypothetical protein
MHPLKIASCLLAVTVAGCALLAAPGLASAGKGGSAAVILAATDQPAASPPMPKQATPGRAYLFRGALGPIFSRGIDRLTKRIEQAGIPASVNEFTICRRVASKAIEEYRREPAPIILIGHSMGGYCALKFAEMLQRENIPVSLVVTIDPAHVTPKVPINVERFINIFLANDVLGGGDVVPEKGYQGHYASYDVSKVKDVLHINIDKVDSIHTQLVAKVQQLAVTPAGVEGESVPLRLVVPRDAEVELWDSGTPVLSRAGDTLQSLAAYYRVPGWALTQLNEVPESAPLLADQRIIVPRHLVPLPAVTGPPPPTRR